MRLNQDKIQRMIDGRGGVAGGGSSIDPGLIAGLATEAWTEENYVSKTFFNELFVIHKKTTTTVYDGDTVISTTVDTSGTFAPNEIPSEDESTDSETGYRTVVVTEVDNIEAKKGLWTDFFLSALGLNAGGGGGGIGDVTWQALGDQLDDRQIASSHLTTALNNALVGYATQSWVTAQNYVTSSAISDMATKTWVNNQSFVNWTALGDSTTTQQIALSHLTTALSTYATQSWVTNNFSTPSTVATQLQTYAKIQNGTITIGDTSLTPITSVTGTFWGKSFTNGGTVNGTIKAGTSGGAIEQFHSVEMNSAGTLSGYGGFIDFHYYATGTTFDSTLDYTSRIIESSVGVISILAKNNDSTNANKLAGLLVGDGYDGSYVQIGNIRIVYDSTNNALKVVKIVSGSEVAANFYATGSVSALGYGSGGGGGTGDVTWTNLADNSDTRQIALSHLTGALAGYATTSQLAGYLPLTGGTLTGGLSLVYGTASSDQWISFKASDNIVYRIGIQRPFANYGLAFYNGSAYYKIWYQGNDGAGSGLDADLLDGQHGSYYAAASALSGYLPLTGGTLTNANFGESLHIFRNAANGNSVIKFSNATNITNRYLGFDGAKATSSALYFTDDNAANTFIIVNSGNISSYNAGSATKLQTARTIWGQSFDGTGNVDGLLTVNVTSGNDAIVSAGNVRVTGFVAATGLLSGSSLTLKYDDNIYHFFSIINSTAESYIEASNARNLNIGFRGAVYPITLEPSGTLNANYGVVIPYGKILVIVDSTTSASTSLGMKEVSSAPKPYWRHFDGTSVYDILHPSKAGTIALESDLDSYVARDGSKSMSGNLTFSWGSSISDQWINFKAADNIVYSIGIRRPASSYGLTYVSNGSYFKIWHEGNDGTGSGLDADLLDGQHGSYYAAASALNDYLPLSGGTLTNSAYGSALHIVRNANNGNVVIKFSNNDTVIGRCLGFDGGQAAASGLYFTDNNNGTAYTVISSGNISSYNAGSATKLQTARTLWGQSFDGTANVTGNLTSVGNITSSNTYFDLIASSGSEIRLRIDSSVETSSLSFASSWFGPFTASKDAISLGRSTARWASLYANTANFYSTGAQLISLKRNASSGGALIGYYANNQDTNVWNVGAGYNYAFIFEYGGSEKVTLTNDGKLGIGKTSPSYALDVDGVIQSTAYRCTGGSLMTCTAVGGGTYTSMSWIVNSARAEFEFPNKTNSYSGEHVPIYVGWRGGVYPLVLASNTNVGISTNSPSSKLHVNGSIKANGNVVSDTSGGYLEGFSSWELNTHNTAGTNIGGFLDFHYNGTAQDYSVRLIEKDYSGVLQILAKDTGTGNAQRAGLIVGAGTYTSFIQIGNGRIVWNDTDHALRIVDADGNACNLYATGGISALGYQSGGGGGGSTGVFSTSITPETTGTYDLGTTTYKWRNLYLAGANGGNGFSIITSYSSYVYIGSLNKILFGADVEFEDTAYVENRMGIGVKNGNYDLYVYGENEGNAYFAGNVSVASLTNRSDMRLKDVVGDVNLSVQQIASAPAFKFRFKEKAKRTMVGTSAQYWDAVLPESVTRDADGILGLDYGVTALVSTIILAKGMTEHERRITKLEKENAELRARIKDLEEN